MMCFHQSHLFPHQTRLQFLIILLLCTLLGCRTPTEEYVDVPVTIAAIEALREQPDTIISKKRKSRKSSAGACGHSAACVLVLPLLVANHFFPKKWDEFTVTRQGKTIYHAKFQTNGEFIESTSWEATEIRQYQRFALPRLGHNIIVQRTRAKLNPDGSSGPVELVPILPQVDLLTKYKNKLNKLSPESHKSRSQLCLEAIQWLQQESQEFLATCLSPNSQTDATSAAVLTQICGLSYQPNKKAQTASYPQVKKWAYEIVGQAPRPLTSAAAIACHKKGTPFTNPAPFGQQLVKGMCAEPNSKQLKTLLQAVNDAKPYPQITQAIRLARKQCTRLPIQVLIDLQLNQPVTEKDLLQALQKRNVGTNAMLRLLTPHNQTQRKVMFRYLSQHPGQSMLVQKLANSRLKELSNQELRILSYNYMTDAIGFDNSRRGYILALFHSSPLTQRADSKKILKKALTQTKRDDQMARLYLALAVLGESTYQLPAIQRLTRPSSSWPNKAKDIVTDNELAAFGLHLLGCSRQQIKTVSQAYYASKPEKQGILCTQPTKEKH